MKEKKDRTRSKKRKCPNEGCNEEFDWCTQLSRHKRICTFPPPKPSYKTLGGKFECNRCFKTFNHQSSVSRHSKSNCIKEKKTFTCSQCSKVFSYKSLLEKHLKVHEKSQICISCGANFRRQDLFIRHREICSDPSFIPSFIVGEESVVIEEQRIEEQETSTSILHSFMGIQ